MIPWFFITFCFLIIAFQTRMKYNDRKKRKKQDVRLFLLDDITSGFSKPTPLDDKMIIRLEERDFPFGKNIANETEEIEQRVKNNLGKLIINTGIDTNTEIKRRFGLKNLQMVIDGEENYVDLLKNLNIWAKKLIELDECGDAQSILEKAVSIGADISETYNLLFEIYEKTGKLEEINKLRERVNCLPDHLKSRIAKTAIRE